MDAQNPSWRERDRARHLEDHAKAYRDPHSVWRWNSNDRTPMADMLADWLDAGLITAAEHDVTQATSARETAEALAAYRAVRANGPTPQERAAARAAHGPGEALTDIITGQTWTT